jgi:hypothetical protein
MTDRLTAADRSLINRARALASARGVDAFRVVTDEPFRASDDAVYSAALGYAQSLLGELAALAERLSGDEGQAAEDSRRLTAIRDLLAHFDWEYHDRQLALEAIDRIAEGGQA